MEGNGFVVDKQVTGLTAIDRKSTWRLIRGRVKRRTGMAGGGILVEGCENVAE